MFFFQTKNNHLIILYKLEKKPFAAYNQEFEQRFPTNVYQPWGLTEHIFHMSLA